MLGWHPEKPLRWLHGQIKSPPFSLAGRIEAGQALRRLQRGELLSMPLSRPMPSIASRCHELRVRDGAHSWRIVYRIDVDAILIVCVFAKTSQQTPGWVLRVSRARCSSYDRSHREG